MEWGLFGISATWLSFFISTSCTVYLSWNPTAKYEFVVGMTTLIHYCRYSILVRIHSELNIYDTKQPKIQIHIYSTLKKTSIRKV